MKKPKSIAVFNERDFPVGLARMTVFQGTGVDPEEAKSKPIIAIANSQTDINTGHMHLKTLAERVKEGVHAAGGLPFEFNVPAPCDILAMGNEGMRYVLAQRDLIADMVEVHVRSMNYDGLVLIASCDKIVPGMIMAAARLDMPAIILTGGPGTFQIRFRPGADAGVHHSGYEDLADKMATATCASCGSCELMGTANTLQSLAEAMGMTLPGTANIPAYHSERLLAARRTGKRIVELVEGEVDSRRILTRKAVENALMVDLAIGGSTNSTLHLPAIAAELGLDLPLSAFNDFNRRIPTLTRISPSGPHGITELYMAGGIPAVMKRLAGDLHLDALTVDGRTVGEIIEQAVVLDEAVIPDRSRAYYPEGATVVLYGNLAPDGAVVKQSAVAKDMRVFTGPARVFDSEADCLEAIREGTLNEGEVLVIRYEGPKGGPGMPEMLAATMGIDMAGFKRMALITDGRFSGATSGPCVGHVSPETHEGGPIAAVRDGDPITIDIPGRKLEVGLSDEEIRKRLEGFTPIQREIPDRYMRRYIKLVGSAAKGAILE
ncbi:MAG: dihydroxy-acid dehydratase [Proteobacteria bacterium]|nr:dihydroxy-acid dehydratase [Pseudomonadota bacterium]